MKEKCKALEGQVCYLAPPPHSFTPNAWAFVVYTCMSLPSLSYFSCNRLLIVSNAFVKHQSGGAGNFLNKIISRFVFKFSWNLFFEAILGIWASLYIYCCDSQPQEAVEHTVPSCWFLHSSLFMQTKALCTIKFVFIPNLSEWFEIVKCCFCFWTNPPWKRKFRYQRIMCLFWIWELKTKPVYESYKMCINLLLIDFFKINFYKVDLCLWSSWFISWQPCTCVSFSPVWLGLVVFP